MNLPRYPIFTDADDDELVFKFVSEGPRDDVLKSVVFTPTALRNLYNLGFGDVHPETGEIDDLAVTDNGDAPLVLSTVSAIVLEFTSRHPEAMVFATGSTPARTRLYRMGLNSNWQEVSATFDVFGLRDSVWESFRRGVEYEAFYVKRKKSNFKP